MGISRITDLFAANVDSVYNANTTRKNTQQNIEASENSASEANTEAVNNQIKQSSESSVTREQRIASLKASVQNRTYSPPKPKVAEALFRDLF